MPIRLPASTVPLLAATALLFSAAPAATPSRAGDYAGFKKENDAAMSRMMTGMNVRPTGDIDADFAAMMIPHHQGAIDMARALLRYGHNERLNAIARGIVSRQEQEIGMMRAAIGRPLPAAARGAAQNSVARSK